MPRRGYVGIHMPFRSAIPLGLLSFHPAPASRFSPPNPPPPPPVRCKLVALTVTSGATQQNVSGSHNWATVQQSDNVIVEATTEPNTSTFDLLEPDYLDRRYRVRRAWTTESPAVIPWLQRSISCARGTWRRVGRTCRLGHLEFRANPHERTPSGQCAGAPPASFR